MNINRSWCRDARTLEAAEDDLGHLGRGAGQVADGGRLAWAMSAIDVVAVDQPGPRKQGGQGLGIGPSGRDRRGLNEQSQRQRDHGRI